MEMHLNFADVARSYAPGLNIREICQHIIIIITQAY